MNEIRILSAAEVKRALPMADAIAGMKAAFAQLSTGKAAMPLRGHLSVAEQEGTTLVMPAYLPETAALTVKVVSVFPHNRTQGNPVIYGLVLALDASSGRPVAMLAGGALTAIRTGAGAGAATDLLARPDANVAAIIGSGVQARTQLEAICTVRRLREVRVYSPTRAHATAFARELAGVGPIPAQITVSDDAHAAVRDADIVCTATTSSTPVFDGNMLKPGAHLNAVGSFLPTMQEIGETAVLRSMIVVDEYESAWAEAGDLIIPMNAGRLPKTAVHAEIGEIVAGTRPGRSDDQQITFFKSVGVAVQDAAAAKIALDNATQHQIGTLVTL